MPISSRSDFDGVGSNRCEHQHSKNAHEEQCVRKIKVEQFCDTTGHDVGGVGNRGVTFGSGVCRSVLPISDRAVSGNGPPKYRCYYGKET